MTAATEPLIDIAGLGARLGVTERFVRRLVDERRLPFHKIGRHVRFQSADVGRWISNSWVEAARPYTGRSLA